MGRTRRSQRGQTAEQVTAQHADPAAVVSDATMVREKRSTLKRKAEAQPQRKVVPHAPPVPTSDSDQSDIEIEISNDSSENTQVRF
jgi:hypothetical protein